MKKQFTLLLVGTLVVSTVSILLTTSKSALNLFAEGCTHSDGYHYEAHDATYTAPGNLEFWACCQCHLQFLEEPDEGNFETRKEFEGYTGEFDSNHIAYIPQLQDFSVKEVRDNYSVVVDNTNTKDKVYKDSTPYSLGDSAFYSLWDKNTNKMYLYVEKGTNTDSISVKIGDNEPEVITSSKEFSYSVGSDIVVDTTLIPVTFEVTTSEKTIPYGGNLKAVLNDNNINDFERNLFTAKNASTAPNIDGTKDEVYGTSEVININYDDGDSTLNEGQAWMVWDIEYLYVYILVRDINIWYGNQKDYWGKKYDSVEFFLNTCQTLPTSSNSAWGWPGATETTPEGYNSVRPYKEYTGETAIWTKPADPGETFAGWHSLPDSVGGWLGIPHKSIIYNDKMEAYDSSYYTWPKCVPFNEAINGYYSVELAIPWSDFVGENDTVEDLYNEIIDFSITINDGDGTNNVGEVTTNKYCEFIDEWIPLFHYWEQLQLIA